MSRAPPRAVILGCAGPEVSEREKRFFAEADPLGFILFARNCRTPGQVRTLAADLRASVERDDAPVLIDQEGGRVARLGPPHWRTPPAGRKFGELHDRDAAAAVEAARVNSRLIAADLAELGIDVDCLPVLDAPRPGADPIIGDRAYHTGPDIVAALGRAAADGLLAGGVLPVIKHIPGHGRANVDSHEALPVVDTPLGELDETDFEPFRALAGMPWAMTAHVVYSEIDGEAPATLSRHILTEIVRRRIGFEGLLVSDDLSMKALRGSMTGRAAGALAAGCDVALHCNGDMAEMEAVAAGCGAAHRCRTGPIGPWPGNGRFARFAGFCGLGREIGRPDAGDRRLMDIAGIVYSASTWVLPVLFAVTLHEAAHGWVAWKLGDDTAYKAGRVTFNPLKHIDPFGTILLPAMLLLASGGRMMFGAAKPVPVSFWRLRNVRRDTILVAAAGPGTNLILAVVSMALLAFMLPAGGPVEQWVIRTLGLSVWFNILLAVFNMFPLPPLDGSRVVMALLPYSRGRTLHAFGALGIRHYHSRTLRASLAGRHGGDGSEHFLVADRQSVRSHHEISRRLVWIEPEGMNETIEEFEGRPEETRAAVDGGLVVDVGGFEGPIDVLLVLAREQKVDLTRISILELADQYLAWVAEVRRTNIELAADYLVMAAWLAYLKSRLLLPDLGEEEEPTGEELAAALAYQLQRLEAMQEAGARLMARNRLGEDFFKRGAPEKFAYVNKPDLDAALYDLLKAYGDLRRRAEAATLRIQPSQLFSPDEALKRMVGMMGEIPDWANLITFLPDHLADDVIRRSALASTFAAALQLAKEGRLDIRQGQNYGPIFVRATDNMTEAG